MEPENGTLGSEIPFRNHQFLGSMLNLKSWKFFDVHFASLGGEFPPEAKRLKR